MVERLNAGAVSCALVAALISATAGAQARLADPTRPPQRSAAADAPTTADQQPAVRAGPRLQSVLISPRRKLAVIDGRTVALGGEVNGARLVDVTETAVILEQNGQRQTLRLNPGVDMKATPR
jgi:MSHA biogenesis protein MshK